LVSAFFSQLQFEVAVFRFLGIALGVVTAMLIGDDDSDGAIWSDFHGLGTMLLCRASSADNVSKSEPGRCLAHLGLRALASVGRRRWRSLAMYWHGCNPSARSCVAHAASSSLLASAACVFSWASLSVRRLARLNAKFLDRLFNC
jgi:hypothetical protein